MRSIILTPQGMEDICADEVKTILKKEAILKNNYVEVDLSREEVVEFAYQSQSTFRILYDVKDIEIGKETGISTDKKFCVRVVKRLNTDYTKPDLEAEIGSNIEGEVNLSKPELLFGALVNGEKAIIGEDIAGDLSVREYKIFSHPKSLKGPIAYAILRFSGWDKKKTLVNVETRSGEIAIEAAYYGSKFPINYYKKDKSPYADISLESIDKKSSKDKLKIFASDKDMRNITASKKNAKIGGVREVMDFTRTEIPDLDVKFQKQEVDNLILSPVTESFTEFRDLFYQADYILNKKGNVTVCYILEDHQNIPKIEKPHAKEYQFKLDCEKIINYRKVKVILRNYKKSL